MYNTDDELICCDLLGCHHRIVSVYPADGPIRVFLATPSDADDNITSSNVLHIGSLVEVLKLPGGTAANILLESGWFPPH